MSTGAASLEADFPHPQVTRKRDAVAVESWERWMSIAAALLFILSSGIFFSSIELRTLAQAG
jgi:hypothetical protein